MVQIKLIGYDRICSYGWTLTKCFYLYFKKGIVILIN